MTYYKVVRRTPQGYKSCYCGGLELTDNRLSDPLVLTYECEEKTTPTVGKIFAFASEDDAKDFARESCGLAFQVRILVGKGRKARKQVKMHTTHDYVVDFWAGKAYGHYPNPEGTVLLDYFTPLSLLPQ